MSPPQPRNLILSLLSVADERALSARDAVAACGVFGIRENAARVALVRLASEGLLEAEGRGTYRLSARATKLAADVATWRGAEELVREWKDGWIAVHVTGLGRTDRALLRAQERALAMVGVRELDRGLYVRPDNLAGGVAAVRERLHELGLDPRAPVFVARDFDAGGEARARGLWDGKVLTRSYREGRRRLDEWLARADRLEPEVAARESYLLGHDAIRMVVFDPLLPAPLVDVDARRAFVKSVLRFDRAGHAIWRRLRTTSPKLRDPREPARPN